MHAELARLVGGGHHDAARAGSVPVATTTGLPRSSGRRTQLDRDEERVHVDVGEDGANPATELMPAGYGLARQNGGAG